MCKRIFFFICKRIFFIHYPFPIPGEIDLRAFYGKPPAEAPAAEVIAAWNIIAMVAGLVLVVLMDIDTFYRSRHWIGRNWRDMFWRIREQRDKWWKEEDPDELNFM